MPDPKTPKETRRRVLALPTCETLAEVICNDRLFGGWKECDEAMRDMYRQEAAEMIGLVILAAVQDKDSSGRSRKASSSRGSDRP